MLALLAQSAIHSQHLPVNLREVFPSTVLPYYPARTCNPLRVVLRVVVTRTTTHNQSSLSTDVSKSQHTGEVRRHYGGEWHPLPALGTAYIDEVSAGDDGLGRGAV